MDITIATLRITENELKKFGPHQKRLIDNYYGTNI